MDELQRAEKVLEAARKKQESDRLKTEREHKELKHRIKEAEIALATLEPKALAARRELDDIRGQIDQEHKAQTQITDAVTAAKRDHTGWLDKVSELKDQAATLEHDIADKRAGIDTDLSAYRKQRIAEVEASLSDTQTTLTTRKAELLELTTEIDTKKKQLADLSETAKKTQADNTRELERIKAELDDLAKRRPELESTIKVLKEQIRRANIEYEQVTVATQKAKVEHENYLVYEKKSRAILENKDRELVTRAAEIEDSSRRLKAQRSFLTPM